MRDDANALNSLKEAIEQMQAQIDKLTQEKGEQATSLTSMQDRISQLEIDLGEQQKVNNHQGNTIKQMDAKIEELTKLLKEQAPKHTETKKIFKARYDEHNRALKASNLRIKQLEKKVQNQQQAQPTNAQAVDAEPANVEPANDSGAVSPRSTEAAASGTAERQMINTCTNPDPRKKPTKKQQKNTDCIKPVGMRTRARKKQQENSDQVSAQAISDQDSA